MPEVSRFFGIIITMNYSDHAPPHFHVRYAEQRALIAIESLALLRGHLSPRVFGMVMEWAALHQVDLERNWSLARQQLPLYRIAPWSNAMLKDVIQVECLNGYQLRLRFEDGVQGVIDVSELVELTGVFAPLKDRAYFVQAYVNADIGTVCWPNGADLDPDVLYAAITGEPIDVSEAAGTFLL